MKGRTVDTLLAVLAALLVVLIVGVIQDAKSAQGAATDDIGGPLKEASTSVEPLGDGL